jgi:hypothetical protein
MIASLVEVDNRRSVWHEERLGIGMSVGVKGQPDTLGINYFVAAKHSALLIQEMQHGVVGSSSGLRSLADAASAAGLPRNAGAIARAARTAGVTVVHCTAENLAGGIGANHNARIFEAARRLGLDNRPGSESEDVVFQRFHGLSPMSDLRWTRCS